MKRSDRQPYDEEVEAALPITSQYQHYLSHTQTASQQSHSLSPLSRDEN